MLLKLKVINIILLYITSEYLLYMIRDLCLYILWKSNPKLQTKHHHYIMVNYLKGRNLVPLRYVNRHLDHVNISKIIHSSQSFYVFPANKDHLLNTGLTFKYSNTTRLTETNYKETVTNADGNVTCACKDYEEFIDKHHGHVITRHLN